MENIALFNDIDVANAIDFAPAGVIVSGLTLTEKKLSAVHNASGAALAYLCASKGKIGKYAREGLSVQGEAMIANAARKGNYAPLAQAIAAITGESLTISNRASFECLAERFADRMRDLKNAGYVTKKDGTQAPSAKRNMLVQVINLITEVQSIAASL
jgi:hypothetical protein